MQSETLLKATGGQISLTHVHAETSFQQHHNSLRSKPEEFKESTTQ